MYDTAKNRTKVAAYRQRVRELMKGELGVRAAGFLGRVVEDEEAPLPLRVAAAKALTGYAVQVTLAEPAEDSAQRFRDMLQSLRGSDENPKAAPSNPPDSATASA